MNSLGSNLGSKNILKGTPLYYICSEYPPVSKNFGGIGVALQAEAEWFAAQGCNVTVVCQTREHQPERLNVNGVTVEVIAPTNMLPGLRALTDRVITTWHIRRLLGNKQGLVITADFSGPIAWKFFKQPLVVQLHGCGTYMGKILNEPVAWKTRFFERRTLISATAIRSVSNYTAQNTFDALGIANKSAKVIPNTVDVEVFYPQPEAVDPYKIMFVGKLSTRKGILVLAEAIVPIFEEFSSSTLTLVGHDIVENGKSIQAHILEIVPKKFHERIAFKGRQSREIVAELMRTSGVFVLPSYIEAFPIVILEALASGRPVVASNRAAISEVIYDNLNGLLAEPSQPSTFTSALRDLLTNRTNATQMGLAGRKYIVDHYTPKQVFGELAHFYETVLIHS